MAKYVEMKVNKKVKFDEIFMPVEDGDKDDAESKTKEQNGNRTRISRD